MAHRHSGFWVQGRYFLPILMAVPLLYGEVLLRHAERLPAMWRRRLPPLFLGVVAALQLGGWWVNSRRYAVGDGPASFFGGAEWSPPWGWTAWTLIAVAGATALALAALPTGRDTRRAFRGGP